MHMLLELTKPYTLFVSTTSQILFKKVCAIKVQQMDLLKNSIIKCLKHLKTLQVGIWVKNVRHVASKHRDGRFAIHYYKMWVQFITLHSLDK
jgi:hypothetical protein